MKLLRYGAPGAEKPGLMDANGDIRDLSAHIDDVTGAVLDDASLDVRLAAAWAAGEGYEEGAAEKLFELLEHPNAMLRLTTLRALTRMASAAKRFDVDSVKRSDLALVAAVAPAE